MQSPYPEYSMALSAIIQQEGGGFQAVSRGRLQNRRVMRRASDMQHDVPPQDQDGKPLIVISPRFWPSQIQTNWFPAKTETFLCVTPRGRVTGIIAGQFGRPEPIFAASGYNCSTPGCWRRASGAEKRQVMPNTTI